MFSIQFSIQFFKILSDEEIDIFTNVLTVCLNFCTLYTTLPTFRKPYLYTHFTKIHVHNEKN